MRWLTICSLTILMTVSCGFAAELPKKVTCSGKVVDDVNKPVAGAKVTLLYLSARDPGRQTNISTQEQITKDDGGFSFSAEILADRKYQYQTLVARKEGLAIGWENWAGNEDKVVMLSLRKPYTLTGIVVDDAGRPVDGAEVRISPLFLGDFQRGSTGAKFIPESLDLFRTTTGANGVFTFTAIPAGAKAEFTVKKMGRATVSTLKPNQYSPYNPGQYTVQSKDIRIVQPVEARIEGKVIEKGTGKPICGVGLTCAGERGAIPSGAKPVVSDSNGAFTFDALGQRTFTISIASSPKVPSSWVAPEVTGTLEAGKTTSGVVIEVSSGGVLEVAVRDANERSLAGAMVYVTPKGRGQGQSSRGGQTDSNGRAIIHLLPGDYEVQNVYKEGYSRNREPKAIAIEDGKTVRLDVALEAAPRITGIVRDPAGKALAGVALELLPFGRTSQDIKSDPNGKFEFTWYPEQWPGNVEPHSILLARHIERHLVAAVDINADTQTIDMKMTPGITLMGKVVDPDGRPIANAKITVFLMVALDETGVTTDQEGRYEYKAVPEGQKYGIYAQAEGYGQNYVRADADNAVDNRLQITPLTLKFANMSVSGIVVDVNDEPVANAEIGVSGQDQQFQRGKTDDYGKFTVDKLCEGKLQVSASVRSGQGNRSGYARANAGDTDVKVTVEPQSATAYGVTLDDSIGIWDPNNNQAAFEGTVVDEAGKPIEGVLVDAWTWYPGNETTTDLNGHFSLAGFKDTKRIEVRFSKESYSPRLIVRQRLGVRNAVIVLNSRTYFEGEVLDANGNPAANALIRAAQGPKEAEGVMITEVLTETRTDEAGKYRLYLQPDTYDIRVNAPGVGVARLAKMIIEPNRAKSLDITLKPAPIFRAEVIDSITGEPVAGVRLFNWRSKDIEGRSDANGLVTISGMLPGKFEFEVESKVYARWWSQQCLSEWSRFMIDDEKNGWQRNFDSLDFDIKEDMSPVTIIVEKGVRIRGHIVDPYGNSVGDATAAPARTGSGNSLTGDTRFSVTTKADGTFEMLLPASGKCQYNLVAHDGSYEQWRTWANGVTEPFKTVPGQEINDVVIQLTNPVTIKGRVTDTGGKPIAGRKVRAHAADKLENRYYDPTVLTDASGNYELKFVRPTKQFIQVEPFWLTAEDASGRSSRVVDAQGQEVVKDIDFIVEAKIR